MTRLFPSILIALDICAALVYAANAALIAAAPEMYALLDRLSHAPFAEDADEWAYEIKSLLAKARGRKND